MSLLYTVYCSRPPADLTPEQLADSVLSAGPQAALEARGTDADHAAAAVAEFAAENTAYGEFGACRLCYEADRSHPIDVINCRAEGPNGYGRPIADLEDAGHPARRQIALRLRRSVSAVEISAEFGWTDPAFVFARAAALCLAAWYDGLVLMADGTWWEVDPADGWRELPPDPPDRAAAAESPPGRPTLRYARPDVAGARPATAAEEFLTDPPAPAVPPYGGRPTPPVDCPACGEELYPIASLRPRPRPTPLARLLTAVAVASATVIYIGGGLLVRSYMYVPAVILAAVLLPVALVPGIGIGLLAHRIPKVIGLRCRKCGWRGRFVWG